MRKSLNNSLALQSFLFKYRMALIFAGVFALCALTIVTATTRTMALWIFAVTVLGWISLQYFSPILYIIQLAIGGFIFGKIVGYLWPKNKRNKVFIIGFIVVNSLSFFLFLGVRLLSVKD